MRKRLTVVLSSGLAIIVAGGRPAGAQDGTVTFTTRNGTTMVEYVKGNQVRFESQGGTSGPMGGGAMIMDGNTGNMTMLLPAQKMYTQIPGSAISSMADSMKSKTGGQVTVTETGKDVVAGIPCTVYTVTGTQADGQPGTGEVCAAPGIGLMSPASMNPNNPMARRFAGNPQTAAVMTALKGKGILKVTQIQNGTKTVEMQVTKIDRSSPPDSLFRIPPSYTKMQMPAGAPGMGAQKPQQ